MNESDPPAGPATTGILPDREQASAAFLRLVDVVATLRGPDGCPWDRAQTLQSIKPYTLEEAYEVLDAIDSGDDQHLVEELGDLVLQVILYAQIACDEGRFDVVPVLKGIADKLVRRHPHVFGDTKAENTQDVIDNWERIKQQEKQRKSVLDGVPLALPALARAGRLAETAGRFGLETPQPILLAEMQRLVESLADQEPRLSPTVAAVTKSEAETADPMQAELVGNLLFTISQYARNAGINPEEVLRERNHAFAERFTQLEQQVASEGQTLKSLSPDEFRDRFETTS